jgi:hypothetical protein
MPKLLGLERTYNEFVDEENRARSRTLQNLRNKIKLNVEDVKPTEIDDIFDEADFMNFADLLARSASNLAQLSTRTAIRVEAESGRGVARTNPFRDNEEFTKLISYFNRLQSITQKQFKQGKVSENDVEQIRRLFLENGTIKNLETIKTAFNQISLDIPAITEQAEIVDRIYKSVDSGLYIRVNFPTSFQLIAEPATITEEAETAPDPALPSLDEPAGVELVAPEGEMVEPLEEEIPETAEARRVIPMIFQPASVSSLRPTLKRRLENIRDTGEFNTVVAQLESFRDSPEFSGMTRGQRTARINEITSPYIVGSGVGLGVGLGRGFGVGLGRGFGYFGYPTNSRFTPLTIYNDDGQNIYALRKFEV